MSESPWVNIMSEELVRPKAPSEPLSAALKAKSMSGYDVISGICGRQICEERISLLFEPQILCFRETHPKTQEYYPCKGED